MIGAGWLARQPSGVIVTYHGIFVPRYSAGSAEDPVGACFPTRIEEYGKIVELLQDMPRGSLLDAGAGYNPEIHVLPHILGEMGFDILALDADPRGRDMPPHPRVLRFQGDLLRTPFPSASYSYWVCVSVLEHLGEDAQVEALREAHRLLLPSGVALLTTDETSPERVNGLLAHVGFDIGPVEPFSGTHLSPRVSWAIARKPA